MDKLKCHTNLVFEDEEENSLTKGRVYNVVDESDNSFLIINDLGEDHYFSKIKGDDSYYGLWFELIK